MKELTLSSDEFREKITLADAYLLMFHFLEKNWEGCWDTELGAILGELSLCKTESACKLPMDGAVLPTFLKSAQELLATENPVTNFSGADLRLQK